MKQKLKVSNLNKGIAYPDFKALTALEAMNCNMDELQGKKNKIEEHNKRQAGTIILSRFLKLFALLDYYNIDKSDMDSCWFQLAYKLAEKHEPSFQIEKAPRGRPSEWNAGSLFGLYCAVEFMKFNDDGKIIDDGHACKLALSKFLKHLSNKSLKTIQNKYAESKNSPFVHFVKEAKNEEQRRNVIMYGLHMYLKDLRSKSSQ